jgi:hypothetical protein
MTRLLLSAVGRAPDHLDRPRLLVLHKAPEEFPESMIANVPLHREITEAWEEHGEP